MFKPRLEGYSHCSTTKFGEFTRFVTQIFFYAQLVIKIKFSLPIIQLCYQISGNIGYFVMWHFKLNPICFLGPKPHTHSVPPLRLRS